MLLSPRLHYYKHFIKHYLSATLIDVLHSPFVFSLYNAAIKQQPALPVFNAIETFRKKLKTDHSSIYYHDYETGALLKHPNKKAIGEQADNDIMPARLSQILYFTIKHLGYTHVIEKGASFSAVAHFAAAINKQQPCVLHVLKASDEPAARTKQYLHELHLDQAIAVHAGNTEEVLPPLLNTIEKTDLFFINETAEKTWMLFNLAADAAHNDTSIVLYGTHRDADQTKIWERIQADPRVTVTIDLFFMGLVFFRREQLKQDFKLRVF